MDTDDDTRILSSLPAERLSQVRLMEGALIYAEILHETGSIEDVGTLLGEIAAELGFTYHALVHHADLARPPDRFLFLQNYPLA
jgi:hypothetical protein